MSNTEIRHILLRYFYDRNRNATSARGKKGSAVKISDLKRELKATHNHPTGDPEQSDLSAEPNVGRGREGVPDSARHSDGVGEVVLPDYCGGHR
jgi:hypothetical protein